MEARMRKLIDAGVKVGRQGTLMAVANLPEGAYWDNQMNQLIIALINDVDNRITITKTHNEYIRAELVIGGVHTFVDQRHDYDGWFMAALVWQTDKLQDSTLSLYVNGVPMTVPVCLDYVKNTHYQIILPEPMGFEVVHSAYFETALSGNHLNMISNMK